MHTLIKNLQLVILREELEIHYCDPETLEPVKMIKFKTIEELEKYINNPVKKLS